MCSLFFFSSRRRHTRCALVTGVQTCALPISASAVRHIQILGRRGPHQIAMTPKELGELGHLERASARVDPADLPPEGDDAMLEPGMRKSVTHLRSFAAHTEIGRASGRGRQCQYVYISVTAVSLKKNRINTINA